MNIKTIILTTAVTSIGFAELPAMPEPQPELRVENTYAHLDSHFVGVGFGLRKQVGHHGIDVGVGCQTLLILSSARAYANYLFFPAPSSEAQAYLGLGVCGASSIELAFGGRGCGGGIVGAQFGVGKEERRQNGGRSFWQVDVGFPIIRLNRHQEPAPIIYLTRGIGF